MKLIIARVSKNIEKLLIKQLKIPLKTQKVEKKLRVI
jgi:hypothetical protein